MKQVKQQKVIKAVNIRSLEPQTSEEKKWSAFKHVAKRCMLEERESLCSFHLLSGHHHGSEHKYGP